MWKTINYKGEKVTWYSEEEYTILEQENQEATEIIAELEWKCKKIEDIIKACTSLKHENKEYIKIEDVLDILKQISDKILVRIIISKILMVIF